MNKILFFSKDQQTSALAESILKDGFSVRSVSDLNEALEHMKKKLSDLIIIDGDCDGINGLESFRTLKSVLPRIKAVLIAKKGNINEAVSAAKSGVIDLLSKPLQKETLIVSIEKILSKADIQGKLVVPSAGKEWLSGLSASVQDLFIRMEEASGSDRDLMVSGKSGVPRAFVARIVHDNSSNRKRKFVEMNMASFEKEASEAMFWTAINELLAEHPHDARSEREASGTIYLEAFDTLPLHFMESVLEYIVNKRSAKSDRDTKIILGVSDGAFSVKGGKDGLLSDFLRLDVPALEERREDIPDIANALIGRFCEKYSKEIKGISLEVLELVMDHSWPGNYDELSSFIESSVLRAKGTVIELADIPADASMVLSTSIKRAMMKNQWDLSSSKDHFQKKLIEIVLESSGRDLGKCAKLLDIPRTALLESIKRLGIRA